MASKKTGNARMQPIRATQPFQLRQGSPARKSPSSSPTPRTTADARVPVRSRWSEHRTSPDRSDRKSPNSLKVSNRRSQSPCIRRTSSLDTIAAPYLTGQWPRDAGVQYQYVMRDKTTQTPDWSNEAANQQQAMQIITGSGKGGRQGSIAEQDLVPQMRKQLRNNAKRSSDKKERSPPVHGNHSALYQLAAPLPKSNPISISTQAFGRIPRRQNSIEALNKEIDMLFTSIGAPPFEPKYIQGLTPPDGHRAPGPRTSSTRTMETQTPQDNFGLEFTKEEVDNTSDLVIIQHSPPSSPAEQLQPNNAANLLRSSTEIETKAEAGISPCPKYASSPRPNNSYKFKREPPEGAENVRPFKEQDAQLPILPSCPDTKKINFFKSTSSAFSPLPSKLIEAFSAAALGPDQTVASLHSPMTNNSIAVNVNNNNSTPIENLNRSPLSTLHSTVEI